MGTVLFRRVISNTEISKIIHLYDSVEFAARVHIPVVQVREIDSSTFVDVTRHLDLHRRGGADETEWSVVWMSIENPDPDGEVVCVPFVSYRDSACTEI